jgi:plastocyanin
MIKLILVSLAALGLGTAALADEALVKQQDKKFSATALKLKVGDTIVFQNNDAFVHNIFSLSDAQSFDLGTFSKGETRKIKLDKPGKVEIECAVHPEMKMVVEVAK